MPIQPRRYSSRQWLWAFLALLIILLVVAILKPDIVRPLGIDPGIFEDIQWFFRRLLGQRDRRPFDL